MERYNIKRNFRRLLSLTLIIALAMSLAAPALAVEDKWKFMKLEASDRQQDVVSISNYADRTANVYTHYQPVITVFDENGEAGDDAIAALLSFSIQYDQPMNLAIYELNEEYRLHGRSGASNVSLASGGAANLNSYDSRGALVGYMYGSYVGSDGSISRQRPFDGDMDTAQWFCGYDGEYPGELQSFSAASIGTDFTYNRIRWYGLAHYGVEAVNETDPGVDPATTGYFYLGEYDDNDVLIKGVYEYVIALEPVAERFKEYVSFLHIVIDYGAAPDNWAFDENNPNLSCAMVAEPVNIATGNFIWQYTDIALYGAETLEFTRTYNSLDNSSGALGNNWRHNYDYRIDEYDLFTIVHMPNGYKMTFRLNYDGSFAPPSGCRYTLEQTGQGFLLIEKDGTNYAFDSSGNITSITKADGNVTSFTYAGGNLATVSNRTGTLSFSYTGDKITSVSDGTGRSAVYTYSGDNLATAENTDGDSLVYGYSGRFLTSITDFNGNLYLRNAYDDQGCIIEQYLADQGTSYFSYDFSNRRNTYTDPSGFTTTYYYDANNNITAIEDHLGRETRTINADGLIESLTDRLGNSVVYGYDEAGNVTSITYPDGTNEQYRYNSLNLVTWSKAKDGSETTFGYDQRGNLTSYTDARGNTYRFTYDSANNMLTSEDPSGATTVFTYDSRGNALSRQDAMGNVTRFIYDTQGRLTQQVNPDNSNVSYEYTTAGKLVSITDADGNVTEYSVTGNGFNDGNTDPMGFSTSTVYNDQNQPVRVTDAEGNSNEYHYDSSGQLIATTNALGETIRYGYDLAGRMTSYTDARGNTWNYSFDAEGRMTSSNDPLDNTVSSAYDSMGRTTSTTNSRNATTRYSFDAMGRTTRVTDALGNYSRNVYDPTGNLIEQYDRNGNCWRYSYDENNLSLGSTATELLR